MASRDQQVFCRVKGALRRTHVLKVSFVGSAKFQMAQSHFPQVPEASPL